MNLRDAILATPYQPELAPVSVPQWAGTEGKLFVRSLSALEHERYLKLATRHETDDNLCFLAEVTALVLTDEQGKPVFTNPADVKQLAERDVEPLNTVASKFREHQKAVDAKKKMSLSTPPNTR